MQRYTPQDLQDMADSVQFLISREQIEEALSISEKLTDALKEYHSDQKVVFKTIEGESYDVSDIFDGYSSYDLMETSCKILCIKALRERTGAGLAEAKDFVEHIASIRH